jgi:MinD-like ATPase involved in chromosome partitioning or flagellar assembly
VTTTSAPAGGSGVLTAGSGHPWESELVAAMSHPGSRLRVVRRCVDIADVVSVAATGQVAVAIVAADLRRLDAELVQELRASRVAVVAVHPSGDQRAMTRLERIGIAVRVPDDAGADAIVAAVGDAVAELASSMSGRPYPPPPGWSGATASGPVGAPGDLGRLGDAVRRVDPRWPADPGSALPGPQGPRAGDPPLAADQPGRPGQVVAVWGPTGGPGRTTISAGLATEAALAGVRTLLIDADVYGGVLNSAFGLLDESPGLAGACRMAANGRLGPAELAALSWQIGERLTLLTGIPRADRWPELRPSSVPLVLRVARQSAAMVVVDCGFSLESDEEISFDTLAPRRNGATLAVLTEADVVLAIGAADPPGMERLVRALLELAEAVPDAIPRVVMNRVRKSAAGKDDVTAALRRFAGLPVTAMLPEDRSATDLAWKRGVPLAEAAPGSPMRMALRDLAAQLVRPAATR